MTEIRSIREEEAVTFLRLLCDAFDIDFARARSVFFNEPMYDISRKWALFEGGEMRSILTTTPLDFGWGRAIGIAGVATRSEDRRKGLAAVLIEEVLRHAEANCEGAALLFARDERLYETLGFKTIDESVRIPLRGAENDLAPLVEFEEVRQRYETWSQESPHRLRRDERRWRYWKWNFRACWRSDAGYVCAEGDTIREVMDPGFPEYWPVTHGSQFVGLRSMAAKLWLDATGPRETALMGRNFPGSPEFFLTDQF